MRVPWNEDMRVKFPATVQFMRLGYEYQSLKDADIHPETRIFLNRFVPAIQRINRDKNLTVEQILATIEEIHGIIKNNDMGKEFLGDCWTRPQTSSSLTLTIPKITILLSLTN